jgi:hypothetical protein
MTMADVRIFHAVVRIGDGSGCDMAVLLASAVICGNMIQLIWSVDALMLKFTRTA